MGTRRLWLAVVVVCGCQPLYHGKQPMKNPEKTTPPAAGSGSAAHQIAWDDNCDSHFFDAATKQKPDHATSAHMISNGDVALTNAKPLPPDDEKSLRVLDAISQYKQALNVDPYNAEATYDLAVAYAMIYKRKCALDLINRLVALKSDPSVEPDATRFLQAAYSESAFQPFKEKLP